MQRYHLLECLNPMCRKILDEDRKWCIAPCMSEKFLRLSLTPLEVIERVWPHTGKIWSGKIFPAVSEALLEVRKELRQRLACALLKRAQELVEVTSEVSQEAVLV